MRHSSAVNIAIRRTVRRDPPNQTEVSPEQYDGRRWDELPTLETVRGTQTRKKPFDTPTIDRLPLLSIQRGTTETLKVFQVANNFVFAQTQKRTGVFTLKDISFRWEGNVLQDMLWGIAIGNELPTAIAQWTQLRRVIPTSVVYDEDNLLLLHPPDIYVQNVNHTISFDNESLIWAVFTDGAQGGDNFVHLQTVLTEADLQ